MKLGGFKLGLIGITVLFFVLLGFISFGGAVFYWQEKAAAACATPGAPIAVANDGSPSIIGPTTASAEQMIAGWNATGKGQPPRLNAPIDVVIGYYISEGTDEGVRGDWALAQAIFETGWFTNNDTSIDNYAGIGHYNDAPSGFAFSGPQLGVRAHIQLLKKFAAGNNGVTGNTDVSPNAGATATTFDGLDGTWAYPRSGTYYPKIASIYNSLVAGANASADVAAAGDAAMSPTVAQCENDVPVNATGDAAGAVQWALDHLGVPYVWGGTDPVNGMDCSGYVMRAYESIGIQLTRTTYTQINDAPHVEESEIQPGDLMYWRKHGAGGGPSHVTMYIGDGNMAEEPGRGRVSKITPRAGYWGELVGITRPILLKAQA